MRADIRCGQSAKVRRTQPNWLVECIKAGIPLHQLPPAPTADASHKEKAQYTWALRKAWSSKTGRTIERLTPPGYNDKLAEARRKERQGAVVSPEVRDLIIRRVLE
ncbi:hypothetical protein DXT98_01075 [Agrobacterium sp. ICMP 7243]|nr:hypothetical protein DXT98_01075 [Agrobacterium sp. ICMP 7243]